METRSLEEDIKLNHVEILQYYMWAMVFWAHKEKFILDTQEIVSNLHIFLLFIEEWNVLKTFDTINTL